MRLNINLSGAMLLLAACCLFLAACPKGEDSSNVSQADTTGADPAVSSSSHSLPPAENPCDGHTLGGETDANPCGGEADANPCGGENPCAGGDNPCGGEAPAVLADASKIYQTANCTMCHGANMEGGQLAPALKNIAGEWNKAELTKYVRDASKYEDSGNRLSHDPKYVIEMPPFPMGEDDLNKLVDWLLTK